MYIGDSVYAKFDGYHIVLETHNGFSDDPRNTIGLEPPVFDALIIYRKQIYEDHENLKQQERETANNKENK